MCGPDSLSGIIVAVVSDEKILEYRLKNDRHDLEFCRTTEGEFDGSIDTDISVAVN